MSILRIYSGAAPRLLDVDNPTGTLLFEAEIKLQPHPKDNAMYSSETIRGSMLNSGIPGYFILTLPKPCLPVIGSVGTSGCNINIHPIRLWQGSELTLLNICVMNIHGIVEEDVIQELFKINPDESYLYWEKERSACE